MKRLKIAASLIVCLITSQLTAQELSIDTTIGETLVPVEITSIRVKDNSPFAISNINNDFIQKHSNGQDIPYILDQTPSVIVNSDAGTGIGYTDIRIRGTDNSRINFTMNGIPVNDAESQGTFFVDFPDILSSTGSIQVQRGVGSSTNGSGAFGASINMSNLQQNDAAEATLFNSHGSFNSWHNMLKLGTGKLSNGFNFSLRLSRQTSDGYIDRSTADLKSLQFLSGWNSKNGRTSIKFNLLTGKEKTGQSWNGVPEDSLKTNRTYNELGIKEDGTYYNDQTDNYRQDYYQLFLNHKFNKDWNANAALFLTRGIGYYNEYKVDESFSTYDVPDFITPQLDTFTSTNLTRQLWLDNHHYGLVYAINYSKNKTNINLGGAASQYDAKHYGYITWANYGMPNDYMWYHHTAHKTDINVYAKWQQNFARYFHLFADLQYRNVTYAINGFRKNPDIKIKEQYNFINPKIGISFTKYIAGNLLTKSYLSLALANKEPNRDDFEASPTELPKSEQLYDWEAGYQVSNSKFSINANFYYMVYKNQLILTGKINDVGAYTRTNVPNSYRAGIELSGSLQPVEWITITANATLSENKIKNSIEYYDDYDNGGQVAIAHNNTNIALSPNTIAGISAAFEPYFNNKQKRNLWIEISGKYISRQYLDNTSNESRSINPYSIFNTKIRYNFTTNFIKDIGLVLAVNNLFDTKYESKGYTFSYIYEQQLTTSNYYFPQAGINYMIGVNLSW